MPLHDRWTFNVVSSKVSYGVIPHDHWYQPDDIDEAKALKSRIQMVKDRVIYGGSVSYACIGPLIVVALTLRT